MTTCYSCGVNKKKKLIIVPPWFLLLIFFSSGAFGVMLYFIHFKQNSFWLLGVVEGGVLVPSVLPSSSDGLSKSTVFAWFHSDVVSLCLASCIIPGAH